MIRLVTGVSAKPHAALITAKVDGAAAPGEHATPTLAATEGRSAREGGIVAQQRWCRDGVDGASDVLPKSSRQLAADRPFRVQTHGASSKLNK
jgi:hypothetical protein